MLVKDRSQKVQIRSVIFLYLDKYQLFQNKTSRVLSEVKSFLMRFFFYFRYYSQSKVLQSHFFLTFTFILQKITPQHFRTSKKGVNVKLITSVKVLFQMQVAALSWFCGGFAVLLLLLVAVVCLFVLWWNFSRKHFESNSPLFISYTLHASQSVWAAEHTLTEIPSLY